MTKYGIFTRYDTSKSTKVLLYRTLVRAIILYNSETWTLKEEQKRKLWVFETSALMKICEITRRDRKRNSDVMKNWSSKKTLFKSYRRADWHTLVMWTASIQNMCFYMVIHMVTIPREDQGRSRLITSVKIVPIWTSHYTRPLASLRTGHRGGTLFSIWAANTRCHRHRRKGNKSSQVMTKHWNLTF